MQRKRAIVLEDEKIIAKLLKEILVRRGYEVLSYHTPAVCPLQQDSKCRCRENEKCTDIIITDIWMPDITGIEYLRNQKGKGCKCKHIAVVSGAWTEEHREAARALSCKIIDKPFKIREIDEWLDDVEAQMDQTRDLASWFLAR